MSKKWLNKTQRKTQRSPLMVALILIALYVYYIFRNDKGRYNRDSIQILASWQESLFAETIELTTATERKSNALTLPEGHNRFNIFSPFLKCPNGEAVDRYGGDNDGGKMLCPSILQNKACVVYSLGSNGDFSFEHSILSRTACEVFTFDCTIDGKSINKNHRYIKLCLGNKRRQEKKPDTWISLPNAMKLLGHSHLTLLKIDIEGAEYDVLGDFKRFYPLPKMISMEIHYRALYSGTTSYQNASDWDNLFWPLHDLSTAEMALFMSHMANLGYGIISREDNPGCPHCSELTLVNVKE